MEGATYQSQFYGSVHCVVTGDNSTVTNNYQCLSPASSYRNILGFSPVANPDAIQQRTSLVNAICTELIQPDLNALVLTGITGIGKTTLASLVYKFVEDQQKTGIGIFENPPLWLKVDATTTFADVVGTLCEALGKPLPELNSLSPVSQARALHSTLNIASSRLIVLDQFECFLRWETGEALPDHLGVSEWLEALNSGLWVSKCRLLLTSRPLPKSKHMWLNVKEFQVKELEVGEGMELLQKLGIQAPEADLQEAVKRCNGHAFALSLLEPIIKMNKITLSTALTCSAYSQLWKGKEGAIAKKMLDHIYKNQLNEMQRKLLLNFSIYREPVQFNAVKALTPEYSESQVLSAIQGLLVQHLLQALDDGYYELHSIVTSYVQDQFDEKTRSEAHEKAALYYQERAKIYCPPPDKRRRISDVHLLTEAVWQFCQAKQCKKAYDVMNKETLFATMKRCGSNEMLLGLLQLFLPLDKWCASPSEAAYIYTYLGDVYRTLGQMTQSREYLEQAKSICEDNFSRGMAKNLPYNWVLNNFGHYYSAINDWKCAQECFEQALDVCKVQDKQGNDTSLSNLGDQITTLNNLGGVYQKQRKKKTALDNYKQALALSKKIGDRGKEATTLKNLGDIYSSYKAPRYKEQALKHYKEALNIQKEQGIRGQEGLTLSSLGVLYNNLGEKGQALEYFKQALNICREVGDRSGESKILYQVGMIYLENDAYRIALACLLTTHEIFELVGSKEQVSVKSSIEELRQKLGQEQFDDLEAQVKQNKREIIEKNL